MELSEQINSLNKDLNDTKIRLYSICSNEKFESHKFNNLINNDSFKIFSKNFKDNIHIIDNKKDGEHSLFELLIKVDDFQKIISNEIEVIY